VVGRFPDGVWLAGVADPGLVGAQVMGALGVRQAGDMPVLEALIYRLQSAERLLVLDNCKQLLDACAQLAAAPGLRVLATSREPLPRVRGRNPHSRLRLRRVASGTFQP
jgi:predicted ATPase